MSNLHIGIFAALFLGLLFLVNANPFAAKDTTKILTVSARAEKRDLIIRRRPNLVTRMMQRLRSLLDQGHVSSYFFMMLCIASFLVAAIIGSTILGDLFMGLVVGICALPLPVIFVILQARRVLKRESEQLEELMSSVTGAYMATNSIISAFESYNRVRLKGLDPKLRRIGPIDEFLIDVHAINPSVEHALRKLQAKLHNRYFDDWVNMLILCQKNKEMRFALQPIIKAFNDSKLAQMESETITSLVWREYYLVLLLLFGLFPVLRMSNEVWYNILTKTFVGRILVSIMIIASLLTAFYVMRVTRPLD